MTKNKDKYNNYSTQTKMITVDFVETKNKEKEYYNAYFSKK